MLPRNFTDILDIEWYAYLSRHAFGLSMASRQVCCFGDTNGICDSCFRGREEGGVRGHDCDFRRFDKVKVQTAI